MASGNGVLRRSMAKAAMNYPAASSGVSCLTTKCLRRKRRGIRPGRDSTAEPCSFWLIGPSAINVLPLKAQVKHRVTGSPTPHYPLEFEIAFCVRGVISPVLSNVLLNEVDRMLEKAVNTTRRGKSTN